MSLALYFPLTAVPVNHLMLKEQIIQLSTPPHSTRTPDTFSLPPPVPPSLNTVCAYPTVLYRIKKITFESFDT